MSGMLKDVVDSIFTPTTKPQAGVVRAMNYSFYALFATLAGLAYATSWNNHVLALSGVAVLLFASISWFIAELGKIEEKSPSKKSDDTSSSSGSSDSKSSNANTKTERNIAAVPGDQSYAEVAAEPPSSSTTNGASTSTSSAVVNNNDRSGLTERKTHSSGAPQSSSTSTSAANSKSNGNNDGASYAEVAAEEPTSSLPSSNDNAIKANKVGVVEAAGMSYINKPSSSSPRTTTSSSNTTTGGTKAGQETYAEAAAEDFDESASVVREDRVGHTEIK